MIDHHCILEKATVGGFAAWLQRTMLGGSYPLDESPAARLVAFPPEVSQRDENGLTLTMDGVRLDTETWESIPFSVPVAVFAVGGLSGERIEVHASLYCDFASGMNKYFEDLVSFMGPDWPERTLTERQRKIKTLRLQGLTIEEIADATFLSVATVNRELKELDLVKPKR